MTATHSETIEARVREALQSGIELSKEEVFTLHELAAEADKLRRTIRDCDPCNKGNSFPMGVGFTRMTKRMSQRIDRSVTQAGKDVKTFGQIRNIEARIDGMLAGTATEAYRDGMLMRTEARERRLIADILGFKRGDTHGPYKIERVNFDKDGYPSSVTISGPGVLKGDGGNQIRFVREWFGRDSAKYRRLIDEAREVISK